jgi:hypothetical protein
MQWVARIGLPSGVAIFIDSFRARRPARVICSFGRRLFWGTHHMLDLLSLAIALGFFAVSIAYVYACDRL